MAGKIVTDRCFLIISEWILKRIKKIEEEYFIENDPDNKHYISFFKYCKFFSISLLRIIKIFLAFGQDAINEYKEQIIHSEANEERQIDKKLLEWSEKWWNKLSNNNKQIFKINSIKKEIRVGLYPSFIKE